MLAQHFAAKFSSQTTVFDEATLAELESRPWYGNVRELRSAIEHAMVIARRGAVMPEHLPPALPNLWQSQATSDAAPQPDFASAVSQIARQLLADPETAGMVYDRFLQQVEPPLLATVMSKCGQRCAPPPACWGCTGRRSRRS